MDNRKKWWWVPAGLAVLCVAGVGGWYLYENYTNSTTSDESSGGDKKSSSTNRQTNKKSPASRFQTGGGGKNQEKPTPKKGIRLATASTPTTPSTQTNINASIATTSSLPSFSSSSSSSSSSSPSSSSPASRHVSEAKDCQSRRDYAGAKVAWTAAIMIDPLNYRYLTNRANMCLLLDDIQGARNDAQLSLSISRSQQIDNPGALYAFARAADKAEDYSAAVEALQECIQVDKNGVFKAQANQLIKTVKQKYNQNISFSPTQAIAVTEPQSSITATISSDDFKSVDHGGDASVPTDESRPASTATPSTVWTPHSKPPVSFAAVVSGASTNYDKNENNSEDAAVIDTPDKNTVVSPNDFPNLSKSENNKSIVDNAQEEKIQVNETINLPKEEVQTEIDFPNYSTLLSTNQPVSYQKLTEEHENEGIQLHTDARKEGEGDSNHLIPASGESVINPRPNDGAGKGLTNSTQKFASSSSSSAGDSISLSNSEMINFSDNIASVSSTLTVESAPSISTAWTPHSSPPFSFASIVAANANNSTNTTTKSNSEQAVKQQQQQDQPEPQQQEEQNDAVNQPAQLSNALPVTSIVVQNRSPRLSPSRTSTTLPSANIIENSYIVTNNSTSPVTNPTASVPSTGNFSSLTLTGSPKLSPFTPTKTNINSNHSSNNPSHCKSNNTGRNNVRTTSPHVTYSSINDNNIAGSGRVTSEDFPSLSSSNPTTPQSFSPTSSNHVNNGNSSNDINNNSHTNTLHSNTNTTSNHSATVKKWAAVVKKY